MSFSSKLADTSDGAIKTREKLFSELKDELETLTSLEEKHLFPVLRKHEETKGLVADAINDNKEVRKLLADLEKIPKTDPEFAPKLGELRKVFSRHVRDEKKELLPAVRKALSDEEVQSVVNKIEAGRAEVEAEKKGEEKERKTEAKAGDDTAGDSRRRLADAAAKMSEASAGAARAPIQAAEETKIPETAARVTKEGGRESAADATRKTAESAAEVAQKVTDTAAQSAQRSLRVVEAGAGVARSASDAATRARARWPSWVPVRRKGRRRPSPTRRARPVLLSSP